MFRYFPTRLDFVTGQLDAFRADAFSSAWRAGSALVWASLGVFGAVTSAVNEAWGVEKQRSFWKHRLVSFLHAGRGRRGDVPSRCSSSASFRWRRPRGLARCWPAHLAHRPCRRMRVRNLATGLLVIGFGLVFYFIPNAKTRFRDVWVGAVLTGLLWRLAFQGFAWYIRRECRPEDDSRVGGRGDRVPPLGLRVVSHPDVRRRVHGRLRAAPAASDQTMPAAASPRTSSRASGSGSWLSAVVFVASTSVAAMRWCRSRRRSKLGAPQTSRSASRCPSSRIPR